MLPSKCQLKQFLCTMNFTCLCSHQQTSSGIFVVGGGGYACSSFGAGSGHFEYFVVRLLRLAAKFSVFLVFSKCISVFCHACSWLAGVWLTTQKAPVAANTKYISLIFFTQVNIEEDDTRIYVDIGNGGHVRWVVFAL